MDGRDPDGEVTEFRPWSTTERHAREVHDDIWPSLEGRRLDWRLAAIAAGAAVVLVAGWFAWQRADQATSTSALVAAPATAVSSTSTTAMVEDPAQAAPGAASTASVIEAPALLTEADLMSGADPHVEAATLAAAEEAVVTHFTTDPTAGSGGPGYVEWARATNVERDSGLTMVTVRFSTVVLSETPWRLPVRTVELALRSDQGTWIVVGLPRLLTEAAALGWEPEAVVEPPDDVRAGFEASGWTVLGGIERPSGWEVVVEDPTGAALLVPADPS